MANQGDLINKDAGLYVSNVIKFSGADSFCFWSDITYFYIAARSFQMAINGNYALITPGYKIWLQSWNGSQWVEEGYFYVKNNSKTIFVNYVGGALADSIKDNTLTKDAYIICNKPGYIFRLAMQPWEGSYREYLGAELAIFGYSGYPMTQKDGTQTLDYVQAYLTYDDECKNHKIGCINADGPDNQFFMLTKEDLRPDQVGIYNTTIRRGSPILASTPPSLFVPVD